MRRAEKKARTREVIRSVAHRMFARDGFDGVTIADIAREADVAVQTVFNHFATKEELFFDGRAEWVGGAARAVRERPDHVAPLSALREHLMRSVTGFLADLREPENRAVIATLEASPALRAYERELHHESVRQLTEELADAHRERRGAGPMLAGADVRVIDPRIPASLTAAIWMSAMRALLIEQRALLAADDSDRDVRAAVEQLAARVLEQFEGGLTLVPAYRPDPAPAVTGWPAGVLRAG